MVGIILAAGDGTRLKKSSGENCCKALKKVNGVYLIEFSLNNLIELDVTDVFIVVGKDGDKIKEIIGNSYRGLKITYVYQPYQKGLINALIQVLNVSKADDVVLQLADEIFVGLESKNIKNLITDNNYNFYCGITYEDDPLKIKGNYSIETDENMLIKKCVEKPRNVVNNLKGTGFCIFKKNVLCLLKEIYNEQTNAPNDLCDFINFLVAQQINGVAFIVAEREFNINTVADLTQVTDFLS